MPSLGNSTTTQKWNWSGLRPPFAPIFFKCIHFKCKCVSGKKEVEATFFQNCYSLQKNFKATLWKSNSLRFLSKVTSLRDSSIFAMNFCTIREIRLAGFADWLSMGRKGVNFKGGGGAGGVKLGVSRVFCYGGTKQQDWQKPSLYLDTIFKTFVLGFFRKTVPF